VKRRAPEGRKGTVKGRVFVVSSCGELALRGRFRGSFSLFSGSSD